jgi:hypothetical protein
VAAGASVPVKFSLGGNFGLEIFAATPSSAAIPCSGGAIDDVEQTAPAGASGLKYDVTTNIYAYVWKTERTWAGSCRQLSIRLADGTEHQASFRFKK